MANRSETKSHNLLLCYTKSRCRPIADGGAVLSRGRRLLTARGGVRAALSQAKSRMRLGSRGLATPGLVRTHICSTLPDILDSLQFAYCPNRSTDNAITLTVHTTLSHLDKGNTYVRMPFADYSSAFNTIVPAKLVPKFWILGFNTSLCNWILYFLMGSLTSPVMTLSTGAPHGRVLSPLLYTLFTCDFCSVCG